MGDHVAICADWTVQLWSFSMTAGWIVKVVVTWHVTANWTGEFMVHWQSF